MMIIEFDEDDGENNISEHSEAMRKACKDCAKKFNRLIRAQETGLKNFMQSLVLDRCDIEVLRRASEEHRERRKEAYHKFWSSSSGVSSAGGGAKFSDNSTKTIDSPSLSAVIPTISVHYIGNGNTVIDPEQVWYFRDKFQNLNLPCLITGLDQSSHFQFVNQNWKSDVMTTTPIAHGNNGGDRNNGDGQVNQRDQGKAHFNVGQSKVNRQWFLEELGEDCLVPLRYIPCNDTPFSLDVDGRATECKTCEVSMKEWIRILVEEEVSSLHEKESMKYYLKDWHLQQRYPSLTRQDDTKPLQKLMLYPHDTFCSCSLYSCPEFFGCDLLNPFLKKFTSGDYRFCYWGPARSFTARHSDVLHSFSWSYNVVGKKEWTFYHDECPIDGQVDDPHLSSCNTFSILQEAGQAIFVPATWQHRVVNLEETISINHNWITSSNLDLTWDCLVIEMIAIQKELQKWGEDQNMEACENMLRGCVGLDVTSFLLMTLVQVLDVITALLLNSDEEDSQRENTEDDCIHINSEQEKRLVFDIFQLRKVLVSIWLTEPTLVKVRERLRAILQSDILVANVQMIAQTVIDDWVQ